jgi:hypothetical protein
MGLRAPVLLLTAMLVVATSGLTSWMKFHRCPR